MTLAAPVKFVVCQGARLTTQSFGTARRGTIVLVMGATASMLWWPQSFCQSLAAGGYQVIRFDLRDTGQSTTGAPGKPNYDLSDLTDDILAILDAYGVASAHIVGMSLGALLGQIVALEHPERVSSLTLLAAEPLNIDYPDAGISPHFMQHFGAMADLDWSNHNAVADFLLGIARLSAGSRPGFDERAARSRIADELARTESIQSAFNHSQLAGTVSPDLRADQLALPVLVIHGTEDPVISYAAAETLINHIPEAQLMRLEGRGHELAPQDIPALTRRILTFIEGP